MPCNENEEAINARDDREPYTPPKPTGNGGARLPIRVERHTREFALIKRWVTGEGAEMDSEDIKRELFITCT